AMDPQLRDHRAALVRAAAQRLDDCRMVRFDDRSGNLAVTDLGRVASHYYLRNDSVETFNERLRQGMPDDELFGVLCHATVRARVCPCVTAPRPPRRSLPAALARAAPRAPRRSLRTCACATRRWTSWSA
ncbi:MAG: hypothetical protein ACK41Y_16725, partial [Paracoccus hibiscisoli]|uniref:hypothetical protein n=1 Tax=Paracoccus hibiscisoli TaxID=2023261 RepID=UPI00391CAA78